MNAGSKRNRALLGLIGLVFLLSVSALGLLAAGGAYADDYTLHAIVDRSGFGVDSASTVKVRGVTVGQVNDVTLRDDGTVDLTLRIRKEVDVPKTVLASIEPLSIFGPKFVDLKPGANEGTGPFLADGDTIEDTVAPSEVIEILQNVSVLLDRLDENDLALILSELARGVDGLGGDIGEIIDSSQVVNDLIADNRAAIDQLLANAKVVTRTLEARSGDFVDIARDTEPALRTLIESEDSIAAVLAGTSRISRDLSAVITAGSDDLANVLDGLDPVTELLISQLAQVPDLLDGATGIFDFIGRDLIQWEVGDGRLGGIVRATVDLDPCKLLAIQECS